MDLPFIANPHGADTVPGLRKEIAQLKNNIIELEKCIFTIQQNCTHVFVEAEGYRKCTKCCKVEVCYY
ncbi:MULTISPECIES: hypothetical protein [Bacillus]|uniref:hypothetical protein n=1 Tax=Bacillus TaxID=1386 RepID=UPI000C780778|nr:MULTISPECIES: hypothetical protein [Bacillus]PLR86670.1 hypothetical protein CVD23_05915 [Bacillus sp. V33-4]RSK44896.1 hypothetical protein EJA13_20560 [Bacillus canaveralius]